MPLLFTKPWRAEGAITAAAIDSSLSVLRAATLCRSQLAAALAPLSMPLKPPPAASRRGSPRSPARRLPPPCRGGVRSLYMATRHSATSTSRRRARLEGPLPEGPRPAGARLGIIAAAAGKGG